MSRASNLRTSRARAAVRAEALAKLRAAGHMVRVINNGALVVIEQGKRAVDFWPSSGKWRPRLDKIVVQPQAHYGGVQAVIQYLAQTEIAL